MANVFENLTNNISIVDEISEYVQLKKKGQNYIGICPFHNDNNPSFTVNEEKKIFKCFVCGVGGNVIKFNQMINEYNTVQAVISLGKKYNIDVTSFQRTNQNNPLYNEKLSTYIKLNTDVNEIFVDMLGESERAQKYLMSRNLKNETINHFNIGYKNKELKEISNLLTNTNVDFNTQESSGLVSFTNNEIIDFFRDRITIPICDEFNNIVGFGSRTIDKNEKFKYLNTKDTPVFNKRNILFNLFNAKKEIFDSNKSSIIVVEGYMDVISLHNHGIKNVVGVMTNNVTDEQVKRLISLNKQIYLCLDYDNAGIQGMWDLIHKYPNINFKIISLENNLDPDEFLNKYGRKKFVEHISNAQSPKEFIFEVEALGFDINVNKNVSVNENVTQVQEPNNVNEPHPFEISQKIESELLIWINKNQQKYLQSERYKNVSFPTILTYEHKKLIRIEYSVFKWFVNGQIDSSRMQEYLEILSTNILKKWVLMFVSKDKSISNIVNVIRNGFIEQYDEGLDEMAYNQVLTWNKYEKQIEVHLDELKKLNNDIIIRGSINKILNEQRNMFILNEKQRGK